MGKFHNKYSIAFYVAIHYLCFCIFTINCAGNSLHYFSPHPYANNYTYSQQVDMPLHAVSMLVNFGSATETELDVDFVVLCKDVTCAENWGNYSGITFPGIYPTPILSIPATSLYISFSSHGQNVNLGFDLTLTPIYGMV